HGAIAYIPYLVIFAVLHNLTQTLGFGIYTRKSTRIPATIDAIAAVIALIFYALFIPIYGIWGAIAATAIALIFRFAVTFYMAQKVKYIPYAISKALLLAFYLIFSVWVISSMAASLMQLAIGLLLGIGFVGVVLMLKIVSWKVKSHEAVNPA
ncbi:MAG: polysaccharide biosynthesis C-terminal domain-containing protein, partial [Alphaproteobacteria bacterium]|nr:polysaccharide biosynthesis C-terminal domain-containing protein [Alphaproteobacteria bacterium]